MRTADRQSRRLLARAALSACTSCPLEDDLAMQEATYRQLLDNEIECENTAILTGNDYYLDVQYSGCCPDVNCVAG